MSSLNTLHGQIKNPRSILFRRLFIKRRQLGTGVYEDDWLEITDDVMKWGSIKKEIDANKLNQFKFSSFNITMSNHTGKYNPSDDENSLWYNYGDQQRTLVKIECGFRRTTYADGIYTNSEFPSDSVWDESDWDEIYSWDGTSTKFIGIISGDININGTDQINFPIAPLNEVFRQFSARRLTGYDNSLTASRFIEMLRDQQDSNGDYIFRPFFGNTSSYWDIESTSVQYTNLNTQTAQDVISANVWEIIEKLAEAENFVPYVTNDGQFKFVSRDASNSAPVYEFFGPGGFSSEYGRTIKKINWYGKRFTKYYSRVQVQFRNDQTTTSYGIVESTFRVSGDSAPWTLGERTLQVQNNWIPTLTVAELIAQQLFDEYSAIRYEIDFSTSFIPHLDILDRVLVTYDSSKPSDTQSLWDVYSWADSISAADDLVWDASSGDALKLLDKEFRLISIELNLDTGESKFIGRE